MPYKRREDKLAHAKRLRASGKAEEYRAKYRGDPIKRAREKALNAENMLKKRRADPEYAAKTLLSARRCAGCINPTGEVKNGPCEICGTIATPLHFDHDHVTGLFRGWLCGPCNRALGMMRDDPLRLELAARYLRKNERRDA